MKTDLLNIPNVGKRTKESLINIGITCVEDLTEKIRRTFTQKTV